MKYSSPLILIDAVHFSDVFKIFYTEELKECDIFQILSVFPNFRLVALELTVMGFIEGFVPEDLPHRFEKVPMFIHDFAHPKEHKRSSYFKKKRG